MADLDPNVAKFLAAGLTTIGHPFSNDAIENTAMDLVRWCKGAFVDGAMWTPEKQARWLTEEVRENWDEWPEKGGTKRLLTLFKSKFAPRKTPDQVTDWANEPCHCNSGRKFRDCCQGKPMPPLELPPIKAHREGTLQPAAQFTPLTPEAFERAYQEEKRRKQQQLRKLDLD